MRRREFLCALAIGAGAGWITKFAQSGGGKRMADRSVVVDTSKSPHAKLRSIPISAVKLRDRFWQPRLIALQEVTIPTQYELMEQTGRIDNFRRVAGKVGGEFRGLYFNDSDVYKWLEAAAWSLAVQPNEKVADLMDKVIAEIEAAQDADGYLNTFFSLERKRAAVDELARHARTLLCWSPVPSSHRSS